jgi:hypothetical protein
MIDLLAGPIVRRTTENRVCVWVATRYKMPLQLTIMNTDGDIGNSSLDNLGESCCKLGENLYVYLLQALPTQDGAVNGFFPKDEILYYRIGQIDAVNEETIIDLAQMGLTYGGDKNPSFIITSRLKQLLHGSCRKPHGLEALYKTPNGAGLADALSYGDDQLDATHGEKDKRPSLLLLTGDQIYADDVPASILEMIKQKVNGLIGFNEEIPSWPSYLPQTPKSFLETMKNAWQVLSGCGAAAPLAAYPFVPADIPVNMRKDVVTQAGFSTDEGKNHLLAFGEFAAMYLYMFGNAEGWTPLYAAESDSKTPGRKEAVERFHETLPTKVRRLLANVSTYMICDDHDVTDDWNITGYWYGKVRDSDTGRRVVANALAAYWAFQGWGNDPDNFDKDLKWVIEQFVNSRKPSVDLAERYDLQMWKYRGWGFSIATHPPIIGIDSRTQRQPDIIYNPPQLLDRYALDWLRVEWQKLKTRPGMLLDEQSRPIFIATTPVMGVAPVEGLQRIPFWLAGFAESYSWVRWVETLLGKQGFLAEKIIEKLDAESWISNRHGYVNFLATLAENMGIRNCVFLSGDLHYSYSAVASFQKGKNTHLDCYQLTSSPLCNSTGEDAERLLEKAGNLVGGNSQHGDPPLLRTTWKVDIHMRRYHRDGKLTDDRIINHCCLGLVELEDGVAVKHRLLNGKSDLYYLL